MENRGNFSAEDGPAEPLREASWPRGFKKNMGGKSMQSNQMTPRNATAMSKIQKDAARFSGW